MTALRPVETWKITSVDPDEERKLLRKVITNRVCAHPDCDKPTESVHHIVPRGTLGSANSSSWFVRIEGVEKPVLHAVGLCGTGTTGHHGELEEHRGWIRYIDGEFVWFQPCEGEERMGLDAGWEKVGPLAPQPGELAPKKARKPKKPKGETRPYRAQWQVGVPVDDRENGADVLDELEAAVREKFSAEMGWSANAPRYHIVISAMVKALQ